MVQHRMASIPQQCLPRACQCWSSPVQLTMLLGLLAILGSMVAAVASHGSAPLNWRATVSQRAGTHGQSAVCGGPKCQPQILQDPVTATGHYLQAAGGAMAAVRAARDVAVGGGNDAAEPELHICYAAEGGLINQHSCHYTALALSVALGAKRLVMPPARQRANWASQANTTWEHDPLDGTWDVALLRRYAARKGFQILVTPATLPVNLNPRGTHKPCTRDSFESLGFQESEVVNMPPISRKLRSLPDFVQVVQQSVEKHLADLAANVTREGTAAPEATKAAPKAKPKPKAQAKAQVSKKAKPKAGARRLLADSKGASMAPMPKKLLLAMPTTLLALHSIGEPLMTEAAMNLQFTPYLRLIADRIIDDFLEQHSATHFNGMHLRVEADAMHVGWVQYHGGLEALWKAYSEALERSAAASDLPLFVASGIFVTNDSSVVQNGLTGSIGPIVEKTPYLTEEELSWLRPEQLAAVDFLILAQSETFVAFDHSTFSVFVPEFQKLNNIPAKPAQCVFGHAPCAEANTTEEIISAGFMFDTYPRKT